jgi:hypothetical protein
MGQQERLEDCVVALTPMPWYSGLLQPLLQVSNNVRLTRDDREGRSLTVTKEGTVCENPVTIEICLLAGARVSLSVI